MFNSRLIRRKTIDAIEVPILAVITSLEIFTRLGIIAVPTVGHTVLATSAKEVVRATETI